MTKNNFFRMNDDMQNDNVDLEDTEDEEVDLGDDEDMDMPEDMPEIPDEEEEAM